MPIRPSGSISLFGRRGITAACVILIAMAFSCKDGATNPPPGPKCPLFPQKTIPLDVADPMIRIVSPNGGEVFHVGQQCTVKVCSKYPPAGGAEMRILVGGKEYTTADYYPGPMNVSTMLGDSLEFALHGDSIVVANVITIPDTLYELSSSDKISSISSECLIEIRAYNPPYYPDTSDCYFSIVK
jgi:hypothetical protein